MSKNDSQKIRIILTLNEEEFFGLRTLPKADFLEIRLDQFRSDNDTPEKILHKIKELSASCVFTYRQPEDSSLESLGIWNRDNIAPLLSGLESGKHYIDLELDKDNPVFNGIDEDRFGIIRSVHSFSGVPDFEELLFFLRPVTEEVLATVKSELPFQRIFKIAALPKDEQESEEFQHSALKLSKFCAKQNIPIGFCGILMGESGKEFRIFPEKIGSQFTYCCLGEPKAPGQVDLETVLSKRKLKD
ncbi:MULTISPECIES: type I 3-dehydroquinate dehydratase [unclassified Leptospira]|uniref:type I 3-dehydroquinate dehydratase n=1 Tax=unclassified Leptospira TaxID=2633828 RepID=UPI0002BE5020|nr:MULTISPECIES: type I 3-dehydroquinate dehydratase [unclassified Leptospira]EMK00049.1 putative 3-dehydroquinate dehydratase, type I [Leptospira sp. B5-022]MCR1792112.1 type I 3-dehydroquinate dehydratase [Leptospira sp. id769339]